MHMELAPTTRFFIWLSTSLEAVSADHHLFETIQHSEQNIELGNFRRKRAESQ